MVRTIVCQRRTGVKVRFWENLQRRLETVQLRVTGVNATAVGGHANHETLRILIDRVHPKRPLTLLKFRVRLPCHVCLAAGGLLSMLRHELYYFQRRYTATVIVSGSCCVRLWKYGFTRLEKAFLTNVQERKWYFGQRSKNYNRVHR